MIEVREQRELQGKTAGWRPIARALAGRVSVRLVQWALGLWKARDRERAERARARERVRVEVLARDCVWSIDATHLGRAGGSALQAEVVKDLATTRLIGASVGRTARAADIVAVLERARVERRAVPLVLMHDNGRSYCSEEVRAWCALHRVLELVNEPRTPEHNAACERGIGELKAESALGRGVELAALEHRLWTADVEAETAPPWCAALEQARVRLNEGRLRGSRSFRTAAELDSTTAAAESCVSRASFHAMACTAIETALRDATGVRARRRAVREAIYAALVRCGLVRRTRGGALLPAANGAGVS